MNSQAVIFVLASLLLPCPRVWSAPAVRLAQNMPADEKQVEDEVEDDFSVGPTDLTPPPDSPSEPEPQALPQEPAVPEGERELFAEPEKPSSSSGEKIFDWSKHRGEEEVAHPFADKGLIRITRKKEYIYKVKESDQARAVDLKVGPFEPTNLANPDTGATFAENYDQASNPAFLFTYEWQLWRSPIGKWGLRAGTGAFLAQGNGRFTSDTNADLTPHEVFTFVMVPLNFGAVYRMQIWHRQMFVPYAEGGGTAFTFGEFRDDDKPPKFGGSLGAYYAAGVGFNLTYFDALSRINLDREYSINSVYLTLEFRGIVSLTRNFDFTSNMVDGGFLMEF